MDIGGQRAGFVSTLPASHTGRIQSFLTGSDTPNLYALSNPSCLVDPEHENELLSGVTALPLKALY